MVMRGRRSQPSRAHRYVFRQLAMLQKAQSADEQRLSRLRQIFAGPVPTRVENALAEINRIQPQGPALLARLERLRIDYYLSPPNNNAPRGPVRPEIIRIVCSDGLVA